MGIICENCKLSGSIVYCHSDAAGLCLPCDSKVHSANSLSKRHMRTLICNVCHSQPAYLRRVEERRWLCSGCNMNMTGIVQEQQAIGYYSDCPSPQELFKKWPFLFNSPPVDNSTCEQGISSLSINDTSHVDPRPPQVNSNAQYPKVLDGASGPLIPIRSEMHAPSPDPLLHSNVQPGESNGIPIPKVVPSAVKGPGIFEENAFGDNYMVDEVKFDMDYDELFGSASNESEHLFMNDGIDDELFMTSARSLPHYRPEELSIGGASVGGPNVMQVMQPPFSTAASADSVISCKTEPSLCFTRPTQSGLSIPAITGENSAGDYQDCGASSMLLMGEPPWFPPGVEIPTPAANRQDAMRRYNEKKKARKFGKTVRYESRKARADIRKRVKGRFVKAGEAYDYDPQGQTRSY